MKYINEQKTGCILKQESKKIHKQKTLPLKTRKS